MISQLHQQTRRHFFQNCGIGLGQVALTSLLSQSSFASENALVPRAKRVIYLFMAGGPSHIDMFDYKPALRKIHGQELPDSIRNGQRITGMTSGQKSFPCVAPMFEFKRHGERGTWVNQEVLPHTASIV